MARDFNTPPIPIGALTFRVSHHFASFWWLGWLYRNPSAFRSSLNALHRWNAVRSTLIIYCHLLPWVFAVAVFGRIVLFHSGVLHPTWSELAFSDRFGAASRLTLGALAIGLVCGLAVGAVLGLFTIVLGKRSTSDLSIGLLVSLVVGFLILLPADLGFDVPIDIGFGVVFGIAIGLGIGTSVEDFSRSTARLRIDSTHWRLALSVAFIEYCFVNLALQLVYIQSGLRMGLGAFLGIVLGFCLGYFRPYYIPLHALFWFFRDSPIAYNWHPVAWDWCCRTPFPFLDRLLVHYSSLNQGLAESELARVAREIPTQRFAALKALTVLKARRSGTVNDLKELSEVLAQLPEGEEGFLGQNRSVREFAERIVRQQILLETISRPYFRKVQANNLVTEISNFQARIIGMCEPLATEFRAASQAWIKLAAAQQIIALESARTELVPQVFKAGNSIIKEENAFLARFRVLEELEAQITIASGCPGLLLRGPRRMGKTSLLKNMASFLPSEIITVFESMQSAQRFSSTELFVKGLVNSIGRRLPSLDAFSQIRQVLRSDPPCTLSDFLGFLTDCNAALERADRRLLVALDEYEMLDRKLLEGVFTKDLLATVRESIQTHQRICWAFSGNADITELSGADWTSYFISVRTVEVPRFTMQETHLLLTEPLKHSGLREEDKINSTLFWREFWGEEGIRRIFTESGGWPFFVQLIAETAVMVANETTPGVKPLASSLLERALEESVSRGRITFYQLLRSPCTEGFGEWDYLKRFASRESQPAPHGAETRRLLKRRQLLMEISAGEWRLAVPLMARWLSKET